ncbi:potassium channel subfamily K member 18 isoform X2 [Lingula anatina]|nr:potassium channel subfamily K member 18 isoform X2 [Lingula anatina]XP_013407147.1 potassium channel subfamily K member 18 isoform X2 [Lingula anatina]|eukprot:XP_013407072.1 potassium channel subfamily K member 18 isoform X2 [Lingula anatina]
MSYSSETEPGTKESDFVDRGICVVQNDDSNHNDYVDGGSEITSKYDEMSQFSEDNTHKEDDPKTKRTKIRKTIIRIVSSNTALVFFLIGYSFIGAAIFQAIEAPVERDEIEKNIRSEKETVARLWNKSLHLLFTAQGGNVSQTYVTNETVNSTEYTYRQVVANGLPLNASEWEEMFRKEVEGIVQTNKNPKWTFWGSLFFCATVYTTVGYGHIVPKSDAGRIATMIYALLGIPLCLITLANLGKLLSRVIKFLYNGVRRQYRKLCDYCAACCKRAKRKTHFTSSNEAMENGDLKEQEDSFRPHLSSTDTVDGEKDIARRAAKERRRTAREKALEKIDDNYNLPVGAAAVILAVYIALGAWMYTIWEVDWKNYLEAFYFLFISLSTIGFGDITPKHPNNFIASFMYILLGFALISMTVNVIMQVMANKIDDTIEKTKKTVVVVEKRVAYVAKSAADVTKRKATIVGKKVSGAIHGVCEREEKKPGALVNGLAMARSLTDSCSQIAKASSDSEIAARTSALPTDRSQSQNFVLESALKNAIPQPLLDNQKTTEIETVRSEEASNDKDC